MNFQLAYTALSRGTSLEKVHFDYTGKVFQVNKPPAKGKCFNVRKRSLLHGKIYKLTHTTGIYIGKTVRTLEQRLKEHIDKPVNENMAKIDRTTLTIELVQDAYVLDEEKELEAVEMRTIAKYNKLGIRLLNKIIPTTEDDKVQIVQQVDIQRFQIKDDETKKSLRIQWRDEAGNKTEKVFRYARKGKEEAMKQAEACRKELMLDFC
jgi:hypothetical protein